MTASAFSNVHDFFHSSSWYLLRNLSLFAVVLLWLGLGFWTFQDARRRIEDPWLVGLAVAVSLVVPFFGALIYMLFRPPEYSDDRRERELELKELEERVAKSSPRCPVCKSETRSDYLVCPVCETRLRQACSSCEKPLEPSWQVCPYCAQPVEGASVIGLHPR